MNILDPAARSSSSDSEERDEDTRFIYEWTKWMTPEQIEPFLNKFTCVKVPIGSFERCFFYYRKYPNDFTIFDSQFNASRSVYDMQRGDKSFKVDQSTIEVKEFKNPFAQIRKSKEMKFKKTSQKILKKIPFNRTMLVVNFDVEHTEESVRKIFGVMGKIRRIFKGKLKKRKRTKSG